MSHYLKYSSWYCLPNMHAEAALVHGAEVHTGKLT